MVSALLVLLVIPCAISISTSMVRAAPEKTELRFEMQVLEWDDICVWAGGAVADLLGEVGIKVDVKALSDEIMYPNLYERPQRYEMYTMSHGYEAVPNHVYRRMHSSNDYPWGDNIYSLHNDTVDKLLEEALRSVPGSTEFKIKMNEVQKVAAENLPYIPLFLSDDTHILRHEWAGEVRVPGGIFTSFNPLTVVSLHNVTNLPSGRHGVEFIMASKDVTGTNTCDMVNERTAFMLMLIYDRLIAYDTNLEPIPWMAESWSVSPDGRNYTFTLRPNLKWHDGKPITTEDVDFSMHYVYEQRPPILWPDIQFLESTKIVDDRTIMIRLNRTYAFGLHSFGRMIPILPKHIWEGVKWDDPRWNKADYIQIGSGPFKWVERVDGSHWYLERNPTHWAWAKYGGNIERFTWKVITTEAARILAIKAGSADTERYETDAPYVADVGKDPNLRLVVTPSQWDYVLGFNLNVSPLNEIVVRKAIAYALDMKKIVNIARLGWGSITNSTVPKCYFPTLYNPETETYDYDPEKAKALLDAAGYKDVDGDGIREMPAVPKHGLTIAVSPSGKGATDPAVGKYEYYVGTNVTVTVSPLGGYEFEYWELDGAKVSTKIMVTVTMDKAHVLTAHLKEAIAPPPGPATVTGKVTDAKTGGPVAGASVKCDGYSATTGPDGTYSLSVKVGSYTVTVSMTGYETRTASVSATESKTYTVSISMPSLPPPPPAIPEYALYAIVAFVAIVIVAAALALRRRKPA